MDKFKASHVKFRIRAISKLHDFYALTIVVRRESKAKRRRGSIPDGRTKTFLVQRLARRRFSIAHGRDAAPGHAAGRGSGKI